jgi:hypothetical protein
MTSPLNSLRQFALTAVVAAGLAAAWCVVVAWALGLAQSAALRSTTYEQPYFQQNGDVVILRYPRGISSTYQEIVDLSGKVSRANVSQLLAAQSLHGRRHVAVTTSADWRFRLAGVNAGGTPAIYWYLVHDGRVNGSAYGVGYNSVTKRLAGYFGRQGFTMALPPRNDWFAIAGDSGLALATPAVMNLEPSWTPERELHLLANGKLWSIDPQKKRVRPLADAPPGATIGWIWDLRNVDPTANAANLALQNTAGWAPRSLAIRTADSLVLVDPASGEHRSVPLPSEFQDSMLAGCELPDGQLSLLAFGGISIRQAEAALRLDPQGQIVQRQAVHLTPYTGEMLGEASMGWFSLLAGPFPAGQGPLVFLMPLDLVQTGKAESYADAFLPNLRRAWPALLGALIIGAVSAAAAYRRQRRFGLPGAIGWAVFAFLFGLPGWIAYRWHRTWPVLAECPACDQPAPRDREACTECGAAFPPPELKGLEVFA